MQMQLQKACLNMNTNTDLQFGFGFDCADGMEVVLCAVKLGLGDWHKAAKVGKERRELVAGYREDKGKNA